MPTLRLVLCAATLFLLTGCATSAPPPACVASPSTEATPREDLRKLDQEQLARKLIEVTMAKSLGKQVLDSMTETLRKMPGLPPGFIDRFREHARIEDLHDLIVPIYARTYDRETMIAAITFYQSEQGQVLVGKLPEATRLSMEAGQRWGQELAERTLEELGRVPAPQN